MQNNSLLSSWVNHTRRNHALEHATLQILAKKFPGHRLAGYSDQRGFWIVGDAPLQILQDSIIEASARLKSGESQLAIHPNCGTNFATAGILAGGSAWLAMLGAGKKNRQKYDRLPLAILASTFALMIAQPLGLRLQKKVTTLAQLGSLEITAVRCIRETSPAIHRIYTSQER